jgi:pimeloyl-ACP methyl ester carboxylesterase
MHSGYLNLNFQKVHYLEAGAGEIIILLPSFLLTSYSYQHIVHELIKSYHVVIPDLYKGCSVIRNYPKSMDNYAEELLEFLTRFGIKKCFVIGISFSGLIANKLCEKRDNRIEKILLLNTTVADIPVKYDHLCLFSGYFRLF